MVVSLLAAGSVLFSSASIAKESFGGFWTGFYHYVEGDEGVPFSVVVQAESGTRFFQGIVIEPNTFAGGGVVALQADVRGRVSSLENRERIEKRVRGKGKRIRGEEGKPVPRGRGAIKSDDKIQSEQRGMRVEFVKTYNGAGGARHSVWYTGHFNSKTNEIRGTWELGDGTRGTFVMEQASNR